MYQRWTYENDFGRSYCKTNIIIIFVIVIVIVVVITIYINFTTNDIVIIYMSHG